MKNRIKVAVIGSGNIGIDLCERILRDDRFDLLAVIGRRPDSEGLIRFENRVKSTLSSSEESLKQIIDQVDGIFDATSAFDHEAHWKIVQGSKKWVIDLTPSKIGAPMSPVLNGLVPEIQIQKSKVANYSMVTCGGQSSAPLLHAITSGVNRILEVEVSSSIASLSAGPATRKNIDNYVNTTRNLASLITKCENAKAILVLNPAEPPVMMRTTVQAKAQDIDLMKINATLEINVNKVKSYVPGYKITVLPNISSKDVVTITAMVEGAGYYLPKYAGNLDIINAAAIETAVLHEYEIQEKL